MERWRHVTVRWECVWTRQWQWATEGMEAKRRIPQHQKDCYEIRRNNEYWGKPCRPDKMPTTKKAPLWQWQLDPKQGLHKMHTVYVQYCIYRLYTINTRYNDRTYIQYNVKTFAAHWQHITLQPKSSGGGGNLLNICRLYVEKRSGACSPGGKTAHQLSPIETPRHVTTQQHWHVFFHINKDSDCFCFVYRKCLSTCAVSFHYF